MRREPWDFFSQLQRNIDENFQHQKDNQKLHQRKHTQSPLETRSTWIPNVDIKEEGDKFLLLADLPGINPKDVDLTIEHGYLTLKGSRKQKTTEENKTHQKTECVYGAFERRFKLPDSVEVESITAKGEHGVLEVTIPKSKKAEPRKIQVTH